MERNLSLDKIYFPTGVAFPNNPSPTMLSGVIGFEHNKVLILFSAIFMGTWDWSFVEEVYLDYNSNVEGDQFSWWTYLNSLAITKGILVSVFSSSYFYA